jgi:hypothetical protein
VKITATQVKGSELKPGDLFSTASQSYWDHFSNRQSIGESVYIRTETPHDADDADTIVYRITIEVPCADCEAAAKAAYSDATTPGFFHDKCTKHRKDKAP